MCTPAPIRFDPAKFREMFPEFADSVKYTDERLAKNFEMASCYVSPIPGKRLRENCHELALYLMTAHLTKLEDAIISGDSSGIVNSATVDKVSVSMTPPPVKNQYQWWLSLTGRGAELLALLRSKAAGGLYVGGLPPERAAFRKAGGVFINAKGSS